MDMEADRKVSYETSYEDHLDKGMQGFFETSAMTRRDSIVNLFSSLA